MRFLFSYLSPSKKKMTGGFIIKFFATVIELFLPVILSHILDKVIVGLNVYEVVFYGGLMIVCSALALILNIIANRTAAFVAKDFSVKLRQDLFERTLNLSAKDTDIYTIPSLEARITTDTYNTYTFILMVQRLGVRAPILFVGGMIISFIMDSFLALVMLITLPLITLTVYFVSKNGIPLYGRVQKSVDGMVRVVREDVQGIRVIKALFKNEYENARYDKVNKKLSKDEIKAGALASSINPIMTLLMNLGIVAVIFLSANRVANGTSSSATVIAFVQYFTIISMAMMALSRMFVIYTRASASSKRIEEIIKTPERYLTIDSQKEEKDYLVFENVTFSYLNKKNNLEKISFSLKEGQTLGIIGATGSGKSTLIKLLLRFYEPNEGRILIDGKDIRSILKDGYYDRFGVCLQNDFLYNDTIEENIKFGRDILKEDVIKATKTAMAYDFIMQKEDGFNYVLSQKATNISGGQKQRLLIARAIANNPEILIFDDSSSALDYKTDAKIRSQSLIVLTL